MVFFANAKGQTVHVAVALGKGKLLHILNGCESRIENGYTLLQRLGLQPVGVIPPAQVERSWITPVTCANSPKTPPSRWSIS